MTKTRSDGFVGFEQGSGAVEGSLDAVGGCGG